MEPTNVDLFEVAETYLRRGWSVIPIGQDKRPPPGFGWKRYSSKRADRRTLRRWFTERKYPALAVICGKVSGNLVCRDFDDAEAYDRWKAAHPNLADTLPTVKTHRGYHVWLIWPDCSFVKMPDGELRQEGHYCLLPPSQHPNGGSYQWLVAPNGEVPVVDPWRSGLVTEDAPRIPVTEDSDDSEDSEDSEVVALVCGQEARTLIEANREEIDEAIEETLPQRFGTRADCLFLFAHRLKSIEGFWNLDCRELKPTLKEWLDRGDPNIRTKGFESNWIEFSYKWKKVKFQKGQTMDQVIKDAERDPVTDAPFESPEAIRLVSLCRALQKHHGEEPFYLSTTRAAEYLGTDRMEAYRLLMYLADEGCIEVVKRGNEYKANRYRYIWRGRQAS